MRLAEVRTNRFGVIRLEWWWPEGGLVLWVGGMIRFKLWGNRWGFRNMGAR